MFCFALAERAEQAVLGIQVVKARLAVAVPEVWFSQQFI
jgi:hypothetical protein